LRSIAGGFGSVPRRREKAARGQAAQAREGACNHEESEMSVMKRWRVEISYKSDRKTLVKRIEEIAELHDLIEHGPDWREI
jgi:hypothetical protein